MEKRTLADMTLTELKIAAWDLVSVLEKLNRRMMVIREEIDRREASELNSKPAQEAVPQAPMAEDG